MNKADVQNDDIFRYYSPYGARQVTSSYSSGGLDLDARYANKRQPDLGLS